MKSMIHSSDHSIANWHPATYSRPTEQTENRAEVPPEAPPTTDAPTGVHSQQSMDRLQALQTATHLNDAESLPSPVKDEQQGMPRNFMGAQQRPNGLAGFGPGALQPVQFPPEALKAFQPGTEFAFNRTLNEALRGNPQALSQLSQFTVEPEIDKALTEMARNGDPSALEALSRLAGAPPELRMETLARRMAAQGLGEAPPGSLRPDQVKSLFDNTDGRHTQNLPPGATPDFGAEAFSRDALKKLAAKGDPEVGGMARQLSADPEHGGQDAALSVLAKVPQLGGGDLQRLARFGAGSPDSSAYDRLDKELAGENQRAAGAVKNELERSLRGGQGQANPRMLELLRDNPNNLEKSDLETLQKATREGQESGGLAAEAMSQAANRKEPLEGAHERLLALPDDPKASQGAKQGARDHLTDRFAKTEDSGEKRDLAHHVANNPLARPETTGEALEQLSQRVSKEDKAAVDALGNLASRKGTDVELRQKAVEGLGTAMGKEENAGAARQSLEGLFGDKKTESAVRETAGSQLLEQIAKGDVKSLESFGKGFGEAPNRAELTEKLAGLAVGLKPDDPRLGGVKDLLRSRLASDEKSSYSPRENEAVQKAFSQMSDRLSPEDMKALASSSQRGQSKVVAETVAEALRNQSAEARNKYLDDQMGKLKQPDGLFKNAEQLAALADQLRPADLAQLGELGRSQDPEKAAKARELLGKALLDSNPGGSQLEAARQLSGKLRELPQEVQNKLAQVVGASDDEKLKKQMLEQLPSRGIRSETSNKVAEQSQKGIESLIKKGAEGQIKDPALKSQVEKYTKYMQALALVRQNNQETAKNVDLNKLRELREKKLPELMSTPPFSEELKKIGNKAVESVRWDIQDAANYLKSDDFQNRMALMSPQEREKFKAQEFGKLATLDPAQAEKAFLQAELKSGENSALKRMQELGSKDPARLAEQLNQSGQALGTGETWTPEEARQLSDQIQRFGANDSLQNFAAKVKKYDERQKLQKKLREWETHASKGEHLTHSLAEKLHSHGHGHAEGHGHGAHPDKGPAPLKPTVVPEAPPATRPTPAPAELAKALKEPISDDLAKYVQAQLEAETRLKAEVEASQRARQPQPPAITPTPHEVDKPHTQPGLKDKVGGIAHKLTGPFSAAALVTSLSAMSQTDLSKMDLKEFGKLSKDGLVALDSGATLANMTRLSSMPKVAGVLGQVAARAGGAAAFIGAGFDGYDTYKAGARGDVGGAIGQGTATVGGVIMGSAVFTGPGFPVVALVGLGVCGIGKGINYFFGDSDEGAILREAGIHR